MLLLDMRDYLIEMCAYVYAAMYCEIKYVLLRIQVNYSGGKLLVVGLNDEMGLK